MNIIVLGAGAIGSFYGSILSKNNDVTLVGRKEHVDVINSKGLQVTGLVEENFKVKAVTEVDSIDEGTVVLLCTKVFDSVSAIVSIKDKLRDDTIIICVQNGVGVEDIVRGLVGNTVVRAIVNQAVSFEGPGLIRTPFMGYFRISESSVSSKLVDDLSSFGLDATVTDDINREVWEKMLVNCILNPLTAILDVPNNGIMDMQNVLKMVLDEVKEVLDAEGVMFSDKMYDEARTKYFSSNISSMLQDIRKGRKTEIDWINGAVVKLGKKHGIDVKVNEMLVSMVKKKEKSILLSDNS